MAGPGTRKFDLPATIALDLAARWHRATLQPRSRPITIPASIPAFRRAGAVRR